MGYAIKQHGKNQKAQILETKQGVNEQEPKLTTTPGGPDKTSAVKTQQNVATNTPAPSNPTPLPTAETKQDTGLLIAQCEAKRSVDYNELAAEIDRILATTLSGTRSNSEARIRGYETTYQSCVVEAGGSAYKAQWCSDDLNTNVALEKDYLQEVIEKLEMERQKSLTEAKQIVDQEYLQCISQ